MFEFKATFDVVMHWSDENIWTECQAGGEDVDRGECKYVWKPTLSFPNAREYNIPEESKYLWTDLRVKKATYQVEVSGTFAAPMSFRSFPQDQQELPITAGGNGERGDVASFQSLMHYFAHLFKVRGFFFKMFFTT